MDTPDEGDTEMPWMTVDDQMHGHRKFVKLGADRLAATGLWITTGSWAAAALTDGFVPDYVVAQWDPELGLAKRLVHVGLWADATVDGETGYQFHDWVEMNRSREEIEAKRAADAERKRQSRTRQKRHSDGTFGPHDDGPGGGGGHTDVTRDGPVTSHESPTPGHADVQQESHRSPPLPSPKEENTSCSPSSHAVASDGDAQQVIHELCALLLAKIDENGFRPLPTITTTWLRDMRLLIDRDGRSPDKIRKMIDWVSQDSFWAPNIRSPKKLRLQWDKLAARANEEHLRRSRTVSGRPTTDDKRAMIPDLVDQVMGQMRVIG